VVFPNITNSIFFRGGPVLSILGLKKKNYFLNILIFLYEVYLKSSWNSSIIILF
jgi:hypothetical protein